MFEAAVDRFGRAVAGAGPVEVGQHVGGSLFQGSAEGSEFDERGRDAAAEAGDELLHQAMATGRVGVPVGGDHSLVGGMGDLDSDVSVVGEQGIKPVLLFVGEQARAGVEGPARRVERVAGTAAVSVEVLLDPAAALVEGVAGEADDVEGIHHRDRVRQFFGGGGLEAGEAVHRDHFHLVAPGLVAFGQPGLEHALGAALDHVQQPDRSAVRPCWRQVDDHGHVLVTAAGVSPHVLIHADRGDPGEPCRVVDQHPLTLGKNRVVRRVPTDVQAFGDPGHRQVLDHDPFQSPPQPAARQPRLGLGRLRGVLAPHMSAVGAPVPADEHFQHGRSPAERFVSEPPHHRVTQQTVLAAAVAPVVRIDNPAGDDRPSRFESLTNSDEPQLVEPAEGGQVRGSEGSVGHVEVFQMFGVRTSILGRPRPLPRHRRAGPAHTPPTPPIAMSRQTRAPKATDAFQRFRVISVLANVRIKVGAGQRSLTVGERRSAYEYLMACTPRTDPTWADVAKHLGLPRGALSGTASRDDDAQERMPLRPPVHSTNHAIEGAGKKLTMLKEWWEIAADDARDALIKLLVDGEQDGDTAAGVAAWEFLNELNEEALSALDGLDLAAGRSAYSLPSLRALTQQMLNTTDDLHAARKSVFGIDDSWTPPAEPIGAPVGNPAVDRVTKIVARWLQAAESEWGAPTAITIEHVREAFLSESVVRERDREMRQRFDANERTRLMLKSGESDPTRVRNADVRRYQALVRQKGQCAYCGDTITLTTSEMDHVVPRKGVGSTNTRSNLLAACLPCNRSKGKIPFAVWADQSPRPGVSVAEAIARTKFWTKDPGASPRSWRVFLKEVQERLARTDEDPEIDARSMESVAWMANELRDRIAARFTNAKVSVYRGAVTAGAREAAGIAEKIPFLGGGGKTRLDRRHHAVDAAVVALLDESVARTLAERNNLREAQSYKPDPSNDWRDYRGNGPQARARFEIWRSRMDKLAALLATAFEEDRVVVMENLRLRLGDGKVHDDTIHQLSRRRVSDAFSRSEIDAASTPALWTALTRDPDYSAEEGLPANPNRQLRLHGTRLGPDDVIEFFDKPRAALAVRGGWAQLGDSIHHARIYRWEERGTVKYGMLRVFTADLLRHRDENLFTVEPKPSWISMRAAHPSIGRADLSEKEYVGWLVPGDELLVDNLDAPIVPAVGSVRRWRVRGFEDASRFNVSPVVLAEEGLERFLARVQLDEEEIKQVKDVVCGKGRRAVTKFFASKPVVIRRDALGRPRLRSDAGLPTCWQTK